MEWFFRNPEVESLAQRHIERAVKLEEDEAKRVLTRYKSVRQELRDRLDQLPAGRFEAAQLRGVLVQVESAILAMSDDLGVRMRNSTRVAAEAAIADLTSEINQWDKKFTGAVTPINIDSVAVATDTSNFLFNQYESSMDSYNQNLRARITSGLTDAIIAQDSLSEVTTRLSKTFLGEEWRILMIARTELHNAYNLGKMRGMEETQEVLPDLQKTLFHPMDARTGDDSKKAAKLELIVDIDEPFVYKWNGETRKFMNPPDRPNDRSILIPYRKAWTQ